MELAVRGCDWYLYSVTPLPDVEVIINVIIHHLHSTTSKWSSNHDQINATFRSIVVDMVHHRLFKPYVIMIKPMQPFVQSLWTWFITDFSNLMSLWSNQCNLSFNRCGYGPSQTFQTWCHYDQINATFRSIVVNMVHHRFFKPDVIKDWLSSGIKKYDTDKRSFI